MPLISDIKDHREKIADLKDYFAIKNFVLSDKTLVFREHPLDEPLVFNGFILTICLNGKSDIRLNYKDYSFEKNDVFTYMPNQIFMVKEKSADFVIENLFLSADYVLSLPLPRNFDLLKKMRINPIIKAGEERIHTMLEYHSLIAKSHRQEDNLYKEEQTKALIYALLMEASICYSVSEREASPTVSRQEILTDEFFSLMLKEYKKERSVAYYADKLCLTPKYLSMAVKKVTGHPISEWLNEVVIIEAKRLLKATDYTALQISEELNFSNPSFFGKFFKQYTGMSPLQYKNGGV